MDRSDNERGGGRLFQRRRPCRFCLEKAPIDFKDAGLLRNFLTERDGSFRVVFPGIACAISVN